MIYKKKNLKTKKEKNQKKKSKKKDSAIQFLNFTIDSCG